MEVKEIFPSIFKVNAKLATINLVKDQKVYDEELISHGGVQYRTWNPYRSKLAAAILNGLKTMEIKPKSSVLYLGAATGTTPSHVSDIIGDAGSVYCVELSERNLRELLKVCEKRANMLPILKDARYVNEYEAEVGKVDVMYQDVSARDQADILLRNSAMLDKHGIAYVAIKSQSISVAREPAQIYKEFLEQVSSEFEVLQKIDIMPYDKAHMFAVLKKKH